MELPNGYVLTIKLYDMGYNYTFQQGKKYAVIRLDRVPCNVDSFLKKYVPIIHSWPEKMVDLSKKSREVHYITIWYRDTVYEKHLFVNQTPDGFDELIQDLERASKGEWGKRKRKE